MKRWFCNATVYGLVFLLCLLARASAQSLTVAEREAEWQSFKVPAALFARVVDAEQTLTFRVPADWQKATDGLRFTSPEGAQLTVIIEEIPEGLPLKGYVQGLMQGLRNLPGGPDAITVRKTEIASLEGREILFEVVEVTGAASRRMIWTTVNGSQAYTFIFIVPAERAAQLEPYFKGVLQSALIVTPQFDFFRFTESRARVLGGDKPSRIDEVQGLLPDLDSLEPPTRSKAIARLATIYRESPDPAMDLLADPRSMIRAAAVEAMALSGNPRLTDILLFALEDREPFVAERAVKRLLEHPNLLSALRSHAMDWYNTPALMQIWPQLSAKMRVQIVGELFSRASPAPAIMPPLIAPKRTTLPPPPPPPPATRITKKQGKKSAGKKPENAPSVGFIAAKAPPIEVNLAVSNRELVGVLLLRDILPSDFKMPLKKILAQDVPAYTALALQVAEERREALPLEDLFTLLASPHADVQKGAARCLARSASVKEIARIEAQIQKFESRPVTTSKGTDPPPTDRLWLADELRATIKRIRLRDQLAGLPPAERAALIKQSLTDLPIANWVWAEYARDLTEGTRPAAPLPTTTDPPAPSALIAPLGENLFPANVTGFVAVPDLTAALDKLDDSLGSIQMDSARGQAMLVFTVNLFKGQVKRMLATESAPSVLDYIGIKPNSPVAAATWRAKDAPAEAKERKAIVMRVANRERFERLLSVYQTQLGGFEELPDSFAIGARLIGLAPALLPLGAAATLDPTPTTGSKAVERVKGAFVGYDQCQGYAVKIIGNLSVNGEGRVSDDPIYVAYVGDAAVLAPDWYALRDVLVRLSGEGEKLAANPEFRRLVAAGGEVLYMSNFGEMFSTMTERAEKGRDDSVIESGALKISNTAWENLFNIAFKDRDWLQAFSPFQPADLASAKEVLPASTVAYAMLKLEATTFWRELGEAFFGGKEKQNIVEMWKPDFEKEILPELGAECGLALLGLPKFEEANWDFPWAIFFKLKSEKLATAFAQNQLFKQAQASGQTARVKMGTSELVVTIKNGYLIFAGNEAALARLDAKERLIATRDYGRALQKTSAGMVIFGGYSIEAANAELLGQARDEETAQAIARLTAMATAFHSQHLYATMTDAGIEAKLSVSLDREGRYSVGELSALSKQVDLAFAVLEARGAPISDQQRLDSLKLKITAKNAGAIDRIKEDLTSAHQAVEKRSESELLVTVQARPPAPLRKAQLPIAAKGFEEYLKPTKQIRSDEQTVMQKAREIVGEERDAWAAARKLADWTYKNLKWKRVDDADAAQTLATQEADCLEFSELFVAMARSLGLPARIVSGIAYSGGAFGGHAWVEVYVGEWVEMDPTWGTEFADATHVRGTTGELLSYTILNTIGVEIIEARRGIPDFQKEVTALAAKLIEELSRKEQSALTIALDIEMLTDRFVGAGAWAQMSDSEHDQMWNAYRRLLAEIAGGFDNLLGAEQAMRLLKVEETGNTAIAWALESDIGEDYLIKFHFLRRGDAWMLTEVERADTDYRIVAELFLPAVQVMRQKQEGKKQAASYLTAYTRVLLAMQQEAKAALELAELSLTAHPRDRHLRFAKALCLEGVERKDEAVKLYNELIAEDPPFIPALLRLAYYYEAAGEEHHQKALEYYERYSKVEPRDPRPHAAMALLLTGKDDTHAEAKYRVAIERDPRNAELYVDLAALLTSKQKYAEALKAIDEGEKQSGSLLDLLTEVLNDLFLDDAVAELEALIAFAPDRLKTNARANIALAQIRLLSERVNEALPLLKRALELEPENVAAHNSLAETYRLQRNWRAALAAAEQAIKLDDEVAQSHYHRACALAQLSRAQEAIAALKRALELDEDFAEELADEADLKPLANLPQFKKLLPKTEKNNK